MQKTIGLIIVLFFIVGVILAIFNHASVYQATRGVDTTATGRYMDVETYVRTNISTLSPVKAQLGGTFYVTSIAAHGGAGTVSYEDGHNAYTADFTYNVSQQGRPSVTSFTVRR